MKRFYISFLLMAAAAVTACENQFVSDEPETPADKYVFTLQASSPGIDTKSEYSAAGEFSWSSGDQISVIFNNGTENKFFTLTTTDNGATASFSGSIDAGYTIGELSSGTKIALYPASDHKYVAADSKPIKFNIPAVTDFTASHYSANMPLYAEGDSGNNFAFTNLACGFRFTFTEVSASKVKFVVENQKTRQLSGDIPLHSGPYLDNQYADVGSEKASLTYIANVENETVTFYVPYRYWADFQPTITLYNADTDEMLFTNTAAAAKQLTSLGQVKPFSISVTGFVYSFPSQHGIDWNSITVSAEGDSSSSNSGVKVFKAVADPSYLFIYFVLDKNKMLTDPSYEYANLQVLYLGDESDANCVNTSWIWGDTETYTKEATGAWLTYNGEPAFHCWEGIVGSDTGNKAGSVAVNKDDVHYEMRIPRDNSKAPMTSTSASTAHVGMIVYYQHYHGNTGSYGSYMITPPKKDHGGALLRVPLSPYVAPSDK
ncbi:MAG: hypothetical protein J5737_02490 [Bacteroidales bacterium]|nr:hypothetical protein [Bacteroidales bacterium]